ncbi:MAG TPA: B-box zinc finger protein [Gaiellales bacterium]|nr:B-box zinc finger protein [Gaiellales bacterium]
MSAVPGTEPQTGSRHCANHPKVETAVSCSECGKPICPDCMVHAAVGIKCRDCARLPRSARVTLKPQAAARAAAAAIAVGTAFGAVLSFAGGIGLGFGLFIIAWVVGLVTGRAVLAAAGRYRATATAWIAVGGAVWAYALPAVVIAIVGGGVAPVGVQALGALIAGYAAHREVLG